MNPPRKRSPENSRLTGTNIKKSIKRGKTYFYYVMPDGSHEPLVHGDESSSIEAAIALNTALRPAGDIVSRILETPQRPSLKNPPINHVIIQFKEEWLPRQGYSKNSLKERVYKINRWMSEWSGELIGDMDTFNVAQFLRGFTAESARQHRILLDQFFRFAASDGYETRRPMLDIEKKKQEKRKRVRHTWEGHLAIYEASPEWLKIGIDAAFYTLQRRSDLVAINAETDIDLKSKTIRVLQSKSEGYDKPVYIDITMGKELLECVRRSRFTGVNCPMLIHKQQRVPSRKSLTKPHAFAVMPDYLTRQYSQIRDEVGVYNHLPKIERPGIHSLRALGIFAYSNAGYSDDYIMALSGHANKKMKDRYYDGHEKPKPVTVGADLNMADLDMSNIDWETDLSPALKALVDASE